LTVAVSDGTLSGVIDFGELCADDPANDLAAGVGRKAASTRESLP
jgi:Ser/Thr protein kinase RdoA (MazF antagonist)